MKLGEIKTGLATDSGQLEIIHCLHFHHSVQQLSHWRCTLKMFTQNLGFLLKIKSSYIPSDFTLKFSKNICIFTKN